MFEIIHFRLIDSENLMGFNHLKQSDSDGNKGRIMEELQIINSPYDRMLTIFDSNQREVLSYLLMY